MKHRMTIACLLAFFIINGLSIAQESSIALPTGDRGPIALDLDATDGDQKQLQSTANPAVDDEITVDIVAVSGAQGQIGFQATLKYDPAQLEWVSSDPKGLFATGVSLPGSPPNGEVVINVAILGGSASADAGSMGHAKFKVLADVSAGAKVELSAAQYGTTPATIGPGGAFVVIGGISGPSYPTEPVARADFGGDGTVDFNDFLAFAGAFGSKSGADKYDARIDLNDDGEVSFNDFLIFAGLFGKNVGG